MIDHKTISARTAAAAVVVVIVIVVVAVVVVVANIGVSNPLPGIVYEHHERIV